MIVPETKTRLQRAEKLSAPTNQVRRRRPRPRPRPPPRLAGAQ